MEANTHLNSVFDYLLRNAPEDWLAVRSLLYTDEKTTTHPQQLPQQPVQPPQHPLPPQQHVQPPQHPVQPPQQQPTLVLSLVLLISRIITRAQKHFQ